MLMRSRWSNAGVAAALFGSVVALLWMSSAFDAEFERAPDEAAHYVTSQMVRDYLLSGGHDNPVAYAERYYARYPKVAFGIWPPLYHISLGMWMLLGNGRQSAMFFMALITAITAFVLFREVRRFAGFGLALLLSLWFVCLPSVQTWTGATMMDMPLCLLSVSATVCFGRYLAGGDWRWSAGFGVLAAAAILTKYNGLALALVPPLAILMRGRFDLLRRSEFWLPAGIVLLLCGPWYVMQARLVSYAMDPAPSPSLAFPSGLSNLRLIAWGIGPLLPMALIGILFERRKRDADIPVAVASLAIACWAFHSVLYPISEIRYLLPAIAAAVLLAGKGFQISIRAFGHQWKPAVVLTIAFAFLSFYLPAHSATGVNAVARDVWADSRIMLIASDWQGEGGFVAAVAERDSKRERIVMRGSKVLARSTWMSEDYELRHSGSSEILRFLDESAVDTIVLDQRPRHFAPHHYALLRAVDGDQRWRADTSTERSLRQAGCMAVYRRRNALPRQPIKPIEVDLTYTLRKVVQVSP